MARQTSCTVVLHDDALSQEQVLCSLHGLDDGDIAYLLAPSAKKLCFVARRHRLGPNDVSLHTSIARQFGFENRMKATIEVIPDVEKATASHVELFFRDQHLSRADMWRIEALVNGRVLYQGQTLDYIGSNVASIEAIYIAGDRVQSACVFHPQTKLIFRSGSTRYVILVQICKEMLESWVHGDLMYERFVDGFFPDLLARWAAINARHLVTIVLFGRCLSPWPHSDPEPGSLPAAEDFFQVVAEDVPSTEGLSMKRHLKRAFNSVGLPRSVTIAADGNMLEAINVAAREFVDEHKDPFLANTGSAIVAITAGSGLFHAEYQLLRHTTKLLMHNSVGVDIVSLGSKPLHPVPLFQYTLDGTVEYALPHWADISYWSNDSDRGPAPMLSDAMAAEIEDISLPLLRFANGVPTPKECDAYDDSVFEQLETRLQTPKVQPRKRLRIRDSNALASGKALPERVVDQYRVIQTRNGVTEHALAMATPSNAASPVSSVKAKKAAVPPLPLMQIGRSISVGPRGLAISSGVASTSITAEYAQHGKETTNTARPLSRENEGSSILAKQIRASLRGKPSLTSLAQSDTTDAQQQSEPIAILTSLEQEAESLVDPASVVEKALMAPHSASGPDSLDSSNATPKPVIEHAFQQSENVLEEIHADISPWLTLLNPCNPRKDNMRVASDFRQWQNVFPTAVGPDTIRWESMTTPAVLPLQRESRISLVELEQNFERTMRRLEAAGLGQEAMRRMIALRLATGFQVVPTRKLKDAQMPSDTIERMLLSIGNYYHELRCLSSHEVQVNEYLWVSSTSNDEDAGLDGEAPYSARIQPAFGPARVARDTRLHYPEDSIDWSKLDDQCVNATLENNEAGHFQMRLVLIPVAFVPAGARNAAPSGLSEEERRLDGIQRLTQIWQRNRFFSDQEQRQYTSLNRTRVAAVVDKDPDPLAIEYQTRDHSAVVTAFEPAETEDATNTDFTSTLFPKSEYYHTTSFDMARLARQIQEPAPVGVEMKDRRWFTRAYLRCFRGDELTTWLRRQFRDIDTRAEAVDLGNQLMEHGLFTHVRGKHEFRDGNYFYQIMSAHRTTAYPDTTSLFTKGMGRSMPSTPINEFRASPTIRAIRGDSDSSGKGSPTPILGPVGARQTPPILLSQRLQYNIDPTGRSAQPEIVNLHYDRIHNPENCYHIKLDWTNCTPKLLRETIIRWASLVDNYGLRLVQVPMTEAVEVCRLHPLESPVSVKLALKPPSRVPATPHLDPTAGSPRAFEDQQAYHKAVLRRQDFVLDLEAASSFPRRLDVAYSWGRPSFQHTQFVHRSGLLLAQITMHAAESDFVLVRNRFAGQWTSGNSKKHDQRDAKEVAKAFFEACKDKVALQTIFEEVSKHSRASIMSPVTKVAGPSDLDIPPMELPAHIMHRSERTR